MYCLIDGVGGERAGPRAPRRRRRRSRRGAARQRVHDAVRGDPATICNRSRGSAIGVSPRVRKEKLIDGNNLDFTHSWLAPFTETNAIFVCFDAAVAISRLTLWNYAKTCVEINQCVRCTRQIFT